MKVFIVFREGGDIEGVYASAKLASGATRYRNLLNRCTYTKWDGTLHTTPDSHRYESWEVIDDSIDCYNDGQEDV